MHKADKRRRSSPTGQTPLQLTKRHVTRPDSTPGTPPTAVPPSPVAPVTPQVSVTPPSPPAPLGKRPFRLPLRKKVSSRRQLDYPPQSAAPEVWAEEEDKALVEFILFYGTGDKWPFRKDPQFWNAASAHVKHRCIWSNRSETACRTRVTKKMTQQFSTPTAAERYFSSKESPEPLDRDRSTQTELTFPPASLCIEDIVTLIHDVLLHRSPDDHLAVISSLFREFGSSRSTSVDIPDDFLTKSLLAMEHLETNGRSNVICGLANAIGTMRPEGEDSRLPVKRMPMGLLEYMVNFFNAESLQQVKRCPEDYRLWQDTMYCLFGSKWDSIFHGPKWRVVTCEQDDDAPVSRHFDPLQARVNVPGIGGRSIRHDVASSPYTTSANIQTAVLDEAKRSHPNTWWWIKADGCDLVKGLGESVNHEWSGDVDLADGKLAEMHEAYLARRSLVAKLGLLDRRERHLIVSDLAQIKDELSADLAFIARALEKAVGNYEEKLQTGRTQEKTMIKLAWEVEDLKHVNETGRQLFVDVNHVHELLRDRSRDIAAANAPRMLTSVRERMPHFIQDVSKHRRTAATHVLVIMISPEERAKKPYALPVQCMPYDGLKDNEVRNLANKVIEEMVKRNMKVAGFVTNGEWNTLRCRGNKRPTSVLELRRMARAKYSKMGYKKMMDMLMPIYTSSGSIAPLKENPAISQQLIQEIHQWRQEGAHDVDVIIRLRQSTVPPGYTYHTWIQGKTETPIEMLRSILAQLEYTYQVNWYHDRGIPFRHHLYVPETHPITGEPFMDREDEGHVFKRIGQSTREGGPREVRMDRFMEALNDPDAGLTYAALTGVRKQSVADVERLFSQEMVGFMEKKGHHVEAEYIQVVRNWRRACDERGLTELQRCRFNHNFLNYIMADLIPWYSEKYDLSYLEVNRPIDHVRGFTRETLIAMAANIESREWRRHYNVTNNVPPEHPRASTSDDVECFFSVMRDVTGKDFTLKQVKFSWRKACLEFTKRMNPDLPFFYHTSVHQRFYEGPMPAFSKPGKKRKEKHPRRREHQAILVGRRATLAEHGARSIRLRFHNPPTELPPLPGSNPTVHEHSYAHSGR